MENQSIEQLLREDLAAANKSFKRSVAVIALLACFFVIYLQVVYSRISGFVTPETLADVAVGFAEAQASDALATLSTTAQSAAPDAAQAMFTFLADSIGTLRSDVEETLQRSQNEIATNTEAWLRDYVDKVLYDGSALAKIEGNDPQAESEALGQIRKNIDKDVEVFFASTVDAHLDSFTKHIAELRGKLQRYATGAVSSPREQEERDLIMAWLQMIDPTVGSLKDIIKAK